MNACVAACHGTLNTYRNFGCRCPSAIREHTRAITRWRLRRLRNNGQPLRISAVGAQRRVQALARIGFEFTWVQRTHGIDRDLLSGIASGRRTAISVDTYRRIADVYDLLYAEDGPSRRAAMRAERAGWFGPEAWDDDTIDDPDVRPAAPDGRRHRRLDVDARRVESAVAGDRPSGLTIAERRAVVAELHRLGMNDREIARRSGISDRTALRIRQELGLTANAGNRLAGAA